MLYYSRTFGAAKAYPDWQNAARQLSSERKRQRRPAMSAWRLNEATESCETVFDRAWGGEPQIIMRDEKPMVVVLSFAAYEAAKPKREPDFMRFAGMLSHEDAEAMSSFVDNASFSRVDEGAWK